MNDISSDDLIKIWDSILDKDVNITYEDEYSNVLKNEFEELLFSLGQVVLLNDKEPLTWEFVYGLRTEKGNFFKIYSSISLHTGKFRKHGKDAIKIIKWKANYGPISRGIRVYRTYNWKSNLTKRIMKMNE